MLMALFINFLPPCLQLVLTRIWSPRHGILCKRTSVARWRFFLDCRRKCGNQQNNGLVLKLIKCQDWKDYNSKLGWNYTYFLFNSRQTVYLTIQYSLNRIPLSNRVSQMAAWILAYRLFWVTWPSLGASFHLLNTLKTFSMAALITKDFEQKCISKISECPLPFLRNTCTEMRANSTVSPL